MTAALRNLALVLSMSAAIGCGGGADGASATAGAASGDSLCTVESDTSPVVAQAGDLSVTQAEFEAELSAIPARARARYNSDRGRKDIAELNKKMYAEAKAKGLDKVTVNKLAARLAAEKAVINALTQSVQDESTSDASVETYYTENKDKYSRPMVRARHILVKDEGEAKAIKAQLDGGADFAELAKEKSKDPGSGRRGGDLGWFTKERMVPEFSAKAFALAVDEISDPVKSKFGFHVIQTQEKREIQPLEEVRPGIERLLSRNSLKDYTDGIKQGLDTKLVGPFEGTGEPEADPAAKKKAALDGGKGGKKGGKGGKPGPKPAPKQAAAPEGK
jgi:peptidyl-prolyl cis-trans isomerase C